MSATYVAIIMDGNGRWAHQHGVPIAEGHRAGADTVKARLRDAVDLGVRELTLFVAFNYGGRSEILDAAERYTGGGEEEFRKLLYAPEMHDPDLLIRTSGEQRISNYLLWQAAYSELHFTDVLWPDFSREDFEAALAAYGTRGRRFGGR